MSIENSGNLDEDVTSNTENIPNDLIYNGESNKIQEAMNWWENE